MGQQLKEQYEMTETLQRELRLVAPVSRAPRFKQDVPLDLHETVAQQEKKIQDLEDMVRVRTSKVHSPCRGFRNRRPQSTELDPAWVNLGVEHENSGKFYGQRYRGAPKEFRR